MTRIGLLVVGHVDPKSVAIAGDYPELFAALLGPLGIELVPYALADGQFPVSLRECDGWICSPSRQSAYDDVPWMHALQHVLLMMVAPPLLVFGRLAPDRESK
jgi:hypothetical protein